MEVLNYGSPFSRNINKHITISSHLSLSISEMSITHIFEALVVNYKTFYFFYLYLFNGFITQLQHKGGPFIYLIKIKMRFFKCGPVQFCRFYIDILFRKIL